MIKREYDQKKSWTLRIRSNADLSIKTLILSFEKFESVMSRAYSNRGANVIWYSVIVAHVYCREVVYSASRTVPNAPLVTYRREGLYDEALYLMAFVVFYND